MRPDTTPILTPRSLKKPSPICDGQPWRERIEIVRLAARTQALYDSSIRIFAAGTPEDLFKAVLSAAWSLVRVDLAALFVVRDKNGRPVCRALRAGRSTMIFDGDSLTAPFADAAMTARAPLTLEAPDPRLRDLPSSFNGARLPAILLAVPIRSGGQDLGVLVAGRRSALPFSPAHVELMQGLADQTSLALEKLRAVEAAAEQGRRAQQLVSVASHELRTPLTALQGFSELLLSHKVNEEAQRNWISLINRETVRLGSLVGELLDVSRLDSGHAELNLEPVSIRDVVEHVLSLWGGDGQRSRFSVRMQAGVPRLKADANKLTQVLANLVSNAISYSPAGSSIRIEVAPRCLAQPSTAHLPPPGPEHARCPAGVSIAIRDRGVGISEDDQAQVFQPFYRATPPEMGRGTGAAGGPKGAGLGLTIARRLVERHGGLMWVESRLGKGSTFGFCLPARPPRGPAFETGLGSGAIA